MFTPPAVTIHIFFSVSFFVFDSTVYNGANKFNLWMGG